MQDAPGQKSGEHAFTPPFTQLALPILAIGSVMAFSARADNGWEGQIVSLAWENDAFAGTDRHYTHGAQLSYFTRDYREPDWTDKLPAFGYESQAHKWGFSLGQEIYTPDDLDTETLIEDDRPYAAWLFGRVAMQRRGESFASSTVMETLALDVGIVGPEALGEETQNALHLDGPAGWDNQLETELGLALRYCRRQLFEVAFNEDWRLQLIPQLSGSAGNVATYLGAGGSLRFGYHAPNEFEVPRDGTPSRFGAYIFSGVEGRWVVRNIFLDGNTFKDSHSVDKEPLVGEFRVGLGLSIYRFEVAVGKVFLTDEFEEQTADDSYGFLTLSYKF